MPKRNTRGADKRRIATVDDRLRALELRRQGYSLRGIADALKLSGPQQASNLLEGAFKDIQSPKVAEVRAEIDERCRILLEQLMPVVLNKRGAFDKKVAAMDRIIRIDRERRQMHGADAPATSVQLTGEVAVKDVRQKLLERLAALADAAAANADDSESDGRGSD